MTTPGEYVFSVLVNGIFTLLVVWLMLRSLKRDPRALRNGAWCVLAAFAGLNLVEALISWSPVLPFATEAISGTAVLLILLSLLALPFALVGNGLLMVRRESRTLGHLLSLLVGLALLALPIVLVLLVRSGSLLLGALGVMLVTAQGCAGLLFVIFLAQTILYSRLAPRVAATAVIILGAGLIEDRVPPLLAGRLQRAVVAASRQTSDTLLPLVPSGGQGPDEGRPEGEAMGQWLREQGVPASGIIVEPEARTTEENLRNSARLLEERGTPGPYLVATNNYHAPRAALLARSLGIDAHAVGSGTAFYFLPSAFLREFVAVLVSRRAALLVSAVVTLAAGVLAYAALST